MPTLDENGGQSEVGMSSAAGSQLESAQSFLIEALDNHLSHRDRFAILHAVIAVEQAR